MNASETKAAAQVMLAFSEGVPIQYRWRKETEWQDMRKVEGDGSMLWNWQEKEYRITLSPRRLWQFQHPSSGLVGPVFSEQPGITPHEEQQGYTIISFVEELTPRPV